MLEDADGFIWTAWYKVPSFNKSMSQTLLCNRTSCQLFWKINCLSWIPVKQSALILWRKGEQLCSSLLKSGLTSFISWAVITWLYRESLLCAKSSVGLWALPSSQGGWFVCLDTSLTSQLWPLWRCWIPQKSSCTRRAVSQSPWADLNQHNAQRTGLALLSLSGDRSFGKVRIIWSMVSQQPKLVCAGTGIASGCAFPPRSPLDQSSQTNDFFLFVVLIFCHLRDLSWVMQEGVQRVPFPVPKTKWNVHRSSIAIRTDLDKEGMKLSQERHVWSSQLGEDFPVWVFQYICKHTFFICFFVCLNTSLYCLGQVCSLLWQLAMHFLLLRLLADSPGLPVHREEGC